LTSPAVPSQTTEVAADGAPHISPSSQDDIIDFAATLERQSEYSRLFRAMESPTQAI
jgi:hypothetical protein